MLVILSQVLVMIISGVSDERVGKCTDDDQEAERQETTTRLRMSAD